VLLICMQAIVLQCRVLRDSACEALIVVSLPACAANAMACNAPRFYALQSSSFRGANFHGKFRDSP
jgi:hypothetical protein